MMPNVRARNEGSLFPVWLERPDGTKYRIYRAVVTFPDGRRRSRSDPSKKVAAEHLTELKRQRDAEVADPTRLRVGPYLAKWAADLTDLAPATIEQHRMIVTRHLIPALGGRRLVALNASDVDDYLATARNRRTGKPLDPQTKRHHRATLRRALAAAIRDGLLSRNAAALSTAPRMDKAERTYLTTAQVRRVIEDGRDEAFWPLWVLILTTGLRVSEALGLGWADVDLAGGTLTVKRQLVRRGGAWDVDLPKTRKSRRTILLTPVAVEALAEQKRRQDADRAAYGEADTVPIKAAVFTMPDGGLVYAENLRKPRQRMLRRLGLPLVTTHDMRHSAASMMLTAGVPLPVIADILGHSSIRVTADLYAHIGTDLRRDAADRLAEALR